MDRNDLNVGIDFGYRIAREVHAVLGYWFGYQMEPSLPGSSVDFSNHYHRVAGGIEGRLTRWCKINLNLGPSYHDFDHGTPPNFDSHLVLLYVDSSAVLTPTARDTLALTVKQFMQPAFGAPSAYEDITYDSVWRHQFCDHAALKAGFRIYAGDWLHPIQRDDWIYTLSAGLDLTFTKHLAAGLAYSYDRVESKIPHTAGREFTRHLGSLSLRYAF